MANKALKAVRHRRQVYRKYIDTNHPACINAARAACSLIKQDRRNFEVCLARKIKDDHKSFYAYVKSKSKSNVGSLVNEHGQSISDAKEKAGALDEFFGSVFTKDDDSYIRIPPSHFHGDSMDRLVDIAIDREIIAAKLQNLKPDKAAGDDNLSPRLLRTISSEIAEPIAIIFRKSLDVRHVPRDWRTANVGLTPLFKRCKRSQVDNYRCVSLTSQIMLCGRIHA